MIPVLTSMGRICPGQYLAENFLFLCVSMILVTFNVTKACDTHGDIIEPELEWMSGSIRFGSFVPKLDSLGLMMRLCCFIATQSHLSARSSLGLRMWCAWLGSLLQDRMASTMLRN